MAEEELRERNERLELAHQQVETERQRYEDLFELAPDGYLITNLNGVIVECNRAAAVLLDRPKQHLAGKPVAAFVSLKDRPAFRRQLPLLQQLERAGEWELALNARGNAHVYAGVTVALVRDTQGNPAALRWLLRDLTQRKQAEAALRGSEARHRFLTDHAQDAIYLFRFRPEPHLEYVSPAIENITGYAPQEFYDDWRIARKLIHPDDLPLVDRHADKLQDLPSPTAVRLLHKHGEVVWVEQRTTLVRDHSGASVFVEAIVRDVTARVRTEVQLEKLRTEFLSVLAHELRTPLTAIKGSASIGLSGDTPPTVREARELFQIVDEQANRLREFINGILDITQIETGLLNLKTEKVEAATLVKDACAAFAKGGTAHKVLVELPDGLPPLKADKRRVAQVFSNLLSNAAHVSPPSEPITISAHLQDDGVLIQVRDRGRGIAPEQLPLLFHKFYKIDAREDRGSGLGLAIAKGIVEAHGGRMWTESAGEGEGASFYFTLPTA